MSIEYVLSCMICKKATGAPEPEVEMYIYCHPYQVSCHCKGSPPNVMHDINKCLCLCGSSSRLVRRERPRLLMCLLEIRIVPQVMRIMKPFENDVAEQQS